MSGLPYARSRQNMLGADCVRPLINGVAAPIRVRFMPHEAGDEHVPSVSSIRPQNR